MLKLLGLDGSTKSDNNYSNFNQNLTSLIFTASQKCASTITMEQAVDVSGDYNVISGVKMVQGIQFTLNCSQMQQSLAHLQTDMTNAITQEAKAQGQMIQFGTTEANSRATIANQVGNALTMASLNEMYNTVNNKQLIKVGGKYNLLKNFDMQQTGVLVADASQKILGQIDAVVKLDNKGGQKGDAETKNIFGFLTDWMGDFAFLWIILILVGLAGGYYFFLYEPAQTSMSPIIIAPGNSVNS